MSFSGYLSDKKAVLLVCYASGLFFSMLLWLFGLGISEIFLLWVCFICVTGSLLANRSGVTWKILTQTEMLSQSVERVLFYARLGSVEKDYFITEVPLKACVSEVLAQNKQFLIQNNACIHTGALSGTVYSDQKWLQFILNQIIINSIKYLKVH